MLNIFARASVSRVTDPIGAALVRAGLTPNAMTLIGTTGAFVCALVFFPAGMLLAGTFTVWGFVMLDLLDGAMARAKGSTPFGAVLDATCDRLVDGALFAAIAWWAFVEGNLRAATAALICLVLAQVISYVKARAEASGFTSADGGLVERAERLIIALVGTGLQGLGVPFAVEGSQWLLAAASVVTLLQRITAVAREARS
ncbi:phosphatidylinositol phosphate synthase [Prauserella muralis]|uniref:Phosphatidylinositol phosphate synthase n=1 Tax=Prauserella muralis TaxID=588067 RepID=A0A2V4AHX7_9PSEU|nr:CDP-alcohol phosphatidyltransferase family protein [Prauserella muralis]PXY19251.1 phosphatidylglycerophosphate synthase [Prauserella muralis]TWE29184.1 CDP-diacylglycerol--glycerol-3-phosphate 3-phosphatidyltransferase [Prauserella muralis]